MYVYKSVCSRAEALPNSPEIPPPALQDQVRLLRSDLRELAHESSTVRIRRLALWPVNPYPETVGGIRPVASPRLNDVGRRT